MNRLKKKKKERIILLICTTVIIICSISAILKSSNKNGQQVNAKTSASTKKSNDSKKVIDKTTNKQKNKTVNKINGDIASGEYMPWVEKPAFGQKIVYLTFDDGPSINNTPQILNLLKQYKINATFFLIGKNAQMYPDLVKREVAEGNAVGNHTYSHTLNYKEGPDGFVSDVNKCDRVLKSIIGDQYDSKLLRFPGGSWDTKYMKLGAFRNAIKSEGYHFVNWNDLNGDAEHGLTSSIDLYERVKKETGDKKVVVILMHDAAAKTTTVDALPHIINYLKLKGYTFKTLR